MKNNNQLIEKLSNDINGLQNKIEHRVQYNIRNSIITVLLKCGIAADYIIPFIVSAIIIANVKIANGKDPFHLDEISEKPSIETIDTSSGIHLEYISYDFEYEDELIEHSTGWTINDKGLYERTITSYRLNNKIDLNDTEKILSMSKQEIEELLVITNIKTISKNKLDPEDSIYNEDAIIVINHKKSEEEIITRMETKGENVIDVVWYIVLLLCWGLNIINFEKIFVKNTIRDVLRGYKNLFRPIDKEELETMKKILELKQENFLLINNEENNIEKKDVYTYKLRRM